MVLRISFLKMICDLSWTDMEVKELLKLLHLLYSNILDWILMNLLNTIHA